MSWILPPKTIFKINFASSLMKPVIPSFVDRGVSALKTEAMKTSIANCFQAEGLVGIARLEEIFKEHLHSSKNENTAVAVPTESEPEEDLGGIEPEEERIETRQPQADSQPSYYLEVFPPDEREIEVEGSAELSEDSAPEIITTEQQEVIKPQTRRGR